MWRMWGDGGGGMRGCVLRLETQPRPTAGDGARGQGGVGILVVLEKVVASEEENTAVAPIDDVVDVIPTRWPVRKICGNGVWVTGLHTRHGVVAQVGGAAEEVDL